MHQILTYPMSPMNMMKEWTLRVVLIEQMILSFKINRRMRLIHPMGWRADMILRSVPVRQQGCTIQLDVIIFHLRHCASRCGVQHLLIRSGDFLITQGSVINLQLIHYSAEHMKAEHFCKLAAVIVPADEQIRVHRRSHARTAGHSNRSDFAAVEKQLNFSIVPIEHSV
ncbi:hypothetical protein D3C75_685500 [compost metagenome]